MSFSENTLIEALKNAQPGERLDFKGIPAAELAQASRNLSSPGKQGKPVTRDQTFDLGPHVKVRQDWWGVQVDVDHVGMQALVAAGGATALAAVGVAPYAAGIIAGVLGIWSAFDRGNGVSFYVGWLGAHWFTPL
jgi:hypothetical protein